MMFSLSLVAQEDEGYEVKLYKMLRKKYIGIKGWIYLKGGGVSDDHGRNYGIAVFARLSREFECTNTFYKGNTYQIEVASPKQAKEIAISILDSRRERLGSSFVNNKCHNKLIFKVQATGIYYIKLTFKDNRYYRGAYVVSVKK